MTTMMRSLLTIISIFYSISCLGGGLTVITYHDISSTAGDDPYAVSRSDFVAQMDYLAEHGFQPISLAYLDKVKQGEITLPAKPVLLTFDDGLKSYYEFAVPLLKIYNYPSIASIVTGWLDGNKLPDEYQGRLMSWKQLKEVSHSGLVEVMSHTNNLHHGIQSNPQGNKTAASITRQYSPETRSYESEAMFEKRISVDLSMSIDRIKDQLGTAPKAIAWPYGFYNNVVSRIAGNLDLEYQFTLEEGPTPFDQLPLINRIIITADTTIKDFDNEVKYKTAFKTERRFVDIQLDAFVDQNRVQQERLLSSLLDGLESMEINMVMVSPFTRDQSRAFFVNDEYELASDILNRTLHLIRTKLPVPFIYLKLPDDLELDDADAFYTQLARLNWFNGIVFTDIPEQNDFVQIKENIKRYHPSMKYGSLSPINNNRNDNFVANDFVVYKVDPESFDDSAPAINTEQYGNFDKTFFLLEQKNKNTSALVRNTMVKLRNTGVKHYGYGPFNYYSENTDDIILGKELSTRYGSGG